MRFATPGRTGTGPRNTSEGATRYSRTALSAASVGATRGATTFKGCPSSWRTAYCGTWSRTGNFTAGCSCAYGNSFARAEISRCFARPATAKSTES